MIVTCPECNCITPMFTGEDTVMRHFGICNYGSERTVCSAGRVLKVQEEKILGEPKIMPLWGTLLVGLIFWTPIFIFLDYLGVRW